MLSENMYTLLCRYKSEREMKYLVILSVGCVCCWMCCE